MMRTSGGPNSARSTRSAGGGGGGGGGNGSSTPTGTAGTAATVSLAHPRSRGGPASEDLTLTAKPSLSTMTTLPAEEPDSLSMSLGSARAAGGPRRPTSAQAAGSPTSAPGQASPQKHRLKSSGSRKAMDRNNVFITGVPESPPTTASGEAVRRSHSARGGAATARTFSPLVSSPTKLHVLEVDSPEPPGILVGDAVPSPMKTPKFRDHLSGPFVDPIESESDTDNDEHTDEPVAPAPTYTDAEEAADLADIEATMSGEALAARKQLVDDLKRLMDDIRVKHLDRPVDEADDNAEGVPETKSDAPASLDPKPWIRRELQAAQAAVQDEPVPTLAELDEMEAKMLKGKAEIAALDAKLKALLKEDAELTRLRTGAPSELQDTLTSKSSLQQLDNKPSARDTSRKPLYPERKIPAAVINGTAADGTMQDLEQLEDSDSAPPARVSLLSEEQEARLAKLLGPDPTEDALMKTASWEDAGPDVFDTDPDFMFGGGDVNLRLRDIDSKLNSMIEAGSASVAATNPFAVPLRMIPDIDMHAIQGVADTASVRKGSVVSGATYGLSAGTKVGQAGFLAGQRQEREEREILAVIDDALEELHFAVVEGSVSARNYPAISDLGSPTGRSSLRTADSSLSKGSRWTRGRPAHARPVDATDLAVEIARAKDSLKDQPLAGADQIKALIDEFQQAVPFPLEAYRVTLQDTLVEIDEDGDEEPDEPIASPTAALSKSTHSPAHPPPVPVESRARPWCIRVADHIVPTVPAPEPQASPRTRQATLAITETGLFVNPFEHLQPVPGHGPVRAAPAPKVHRQPKRQPRTTSPLSTSVTASRSSMAMAPILPAVTQATTAVSTTIVSSAQTLRIEPNDDDDAGDVSDTEMPPVPTPRFGESQSSSPPRGSGIRAVRAQMSSTSTSLSPRQATPDLPSARADPSRPASEQSTRRRPGSGAPARVPIGTVVAQFEPTPRLQPESEEALVPDDGGVVESKATEEPTDADHDEAVDAHDLAGDDETTETILARRELRQAMDHTDGWTQRFGHQTVKTVVEEQLEACRELRAAVAARIAAMREAQDRR